MDEEKVQLQELHLDPGRGLHGVLRYRRELPDRRIRLQPQSYSDLSATCEFCGTTAKPPLEPKHKGSEDFCCLRYREVFEEVIHETRIALKTFEEQPGRQDDVFSIGEEEQELKTEEWESKEQRLQQQEIERYYLEAAARLSSEISLFHTNTISFQLSGCGPREGSQAKKLDCSEENKPKPWNYHSSSGSVSATFGLYCHQDNARFIQKFYSNGNKFLTWLPDGSAQVFYPSGNLAIILLTNEKESICIVHDDLSPHWPIRALFQSSGRATCYHGNGSVWLSMDVWGGQSLAEGGARTRRWSWTDHAQTPTPLRPIFLSLNQNVGVRVLGRQCVFVTFLASGQQARFSVGSCVKRTQVKEGEGPPHGPLQCKEELFLLASRVCVRLALTRLGGCQHWPVGPRPPRPPPGFLAVGRKLLKLSHGVLMEDSDRAFIQHCLRDYQ